MHSYIQRHLKAAVTRKNNSTGWFWARKNSSNASVQGVAHSSKSF
jgi:hypothetical protein